MNTIMLKTIGPSEINCNKITDLTLLIISLSGFVFGVTGSVVYDPLLGSGYIGTGLFAGISLYSIKKMRLRETIATSVSSLSDENNELKENNEELKENNEKLEDNLNVLSQNNMELNNIKSELNKDIDVLKGIVGLIGSNSEQSFNKLKEIHYKLELENNKHSLLIKSQTSLLLMNIINHFDKNSNFVLDNTEIEYAKKAILNIVPSVEWTQIQNKIQNNELKMESILELI